LPADLFLRCTDKARERYLSLPGLEREFQVTLEGEPEYCAIDFESTGFDFERDRLIEVAALKMRGEEVIDRLQSLIDPGVPIPGFIRALTGIDDEAVRGSPDIEQFLPELADFLGDLPVVAYSRMEERFLSALYPRLLGRSFGNPYIDAMDLAITLLPSLRSHRQADLAAIWGIEVGQEHRAVDDVLTLSRVYSALLNGLYNAPLPVIRALCDHAPEERGGFSRLLDRVLEERSGGRPVDRLDLGQYISRNRFWEDIAPLVGDTAPGAVDSSEVRSLFAPGGPIARQFGDYEERDEQLEMALAARRAFENGEVLMVEAGTGTGKSLAYLVPAVLRARSRELPVVVSTRTLNLQDQLYTKDLPLLEEALGEGFFRYTVLKGYSNYICLRKLQGLIDGKKRLTEERLGIFGMLMTWLAEGADGDVSMLNVSFLRGLNDQVMADYRECPGERCRFAHEGYCYYRAALYRAKRSHIVVVNHSLLLSGINLPFESAVIDEAQTLEDVATEAFTAEFGYSSTKRFLESLYSPGDGSGFIPDLIGGLVGRLEPRARAGGQERVLEAQDAVDTCIEDMNRVFHALSEFALGERADATDIRFNRRWLDSAEYDRLVSEGLRLEGSLDGLIALVGRVKVMGEGKAEDPAALEPVLMDLDGKIARLEELKERIDFILEARPDVLVAWATVAGPGRLEYQALRASPLDVGPLLHQALYEPLESVVLTSATLTVNGSFEFFRTRTGLDLVERDRLESLVLDSSFDYRRQMQVLILHDMPSPRSKDYEKGVASVLGEVIRAAGGGVLALFTNRRLMTETYESLVEELERDGHTLLCQLPGHSRRRLAEKFVEDESSSLFGTSSFWEGVDARGYTLRVVVVTRIPFESPGRPVFEARSELLRQNGMSDFSSLSLPLAALRLKQGVGRLIRTRQDRGQALIIDSRIETEEYGRVLLRSLPEATVRRVSLSELAAAISGFLEGSSPGSQP